MSKYAIFQTCYALCICAQRILSLFLPELHDYCVFCVLRALMMNASRAKALMTMINGVARNTAWQQFKELSGHFGACIKNIQPCYRLRCQRSEKRRKKFTSLYALSFFHCFIEGPVARGKLNSPVYCTVCILYKLAYNITQNSNVLIRFGSTRQTKIQDSSREFLSLFQNEQSSNLRNGGKKCGH